MEHGDLSESTAEYRAGDRDPSNRSRIVSQPPLTTTMTTTALTVSQSFPSNYFHHAIPELEIYQAGSLTVLGFGGREIVDQLNLAECYDEFMSLVRDYHCRTLALDLTGVRLIPSGLLGVLMSVFRQRIEIHLYNASKDIREVLEITKLDRIWHIHEIDFEKPDA